MIFEIEVRPGQGSTDFFTPYKETVEANTSQDAVSRVQRRNPGCQVFVVNSYNAPVNRGGGGGSASSPGGCGGVILLILGAIIIGALGGGEKEGRPSTPPESLSQPQSRVAEPYTPAAPEPQFRDYPTPPPSYCVTENFEPC